MVFPQCRYRVDRYYPVNTPAANWDAVTGRVVATIHTNRLVVADLEVDNVIFWVDVIVLEIIVHPEHLDHIGGRLEGIGQPVISDGFGELTKRLLNGDGVHLGGDLHAIPGERKQQENYQDTKLTYHYLTTLSLTTA